MPCVPMFDPPWVPQSTGSVQDPINEDQSKSFSARAVSRSHQRAEHILKNLQQEEEKRRLGREASIITSIPITQEACYEPTCSPPSEQEEEVCVQVHTAIEWGITLYSAGHEESTWYDREAHVCLYLAFQDELNRCEESTWYDREAHVCLCLAFQDELKRCEESTWYDREAHVCLYLAFQDELNRCEESTWYDREAHVCLYLAFQDELNGCEESTWYDREAHVCLYLAFQDELNGCEESTWYDREDYVCLCLVFQDELNGCEESTWYDREAHVCLYLAFQDELNGREESTWYDREAHVCLYLAFQDELNGREESTWYDREAHVHTAIEWGITLYSAGREESTWYDREAHVCLYLAFQDELKRYEESTWYDREAHVCLCLVFQDELNGCEESTWYDREAHVCLYLAFQDELKRYEESTWYDREAHVCLCLVFQDELIYMLRKLLLNIGDLPAQTSHILFNYLVGLIMYFVRTPCEWGMDAISATLTFLWEVVGYVEGLFFKDLKQTMKKEQCEVKLLVTASMPGTKTLVVHGQNECDIPRGHTVRGSAQGTPVLLGPLSECVPVRSCSGLSRIVSQSDPARECLEFFNIPEAQSARYFLMDKRWNLIHYAKTYVRDIYPFRRSVSPQLNLVHMLPDKGQELIQKQVFSRKLEEVGRVLFLISLTQNMPAVHKQSHVSLLQEDLLRLPSFPRNAVDAEFSLFSDPQGKELFGLDTLHKVLWIKLLEEMFLGMPSEYPWGDEIMLFLNVFNGVLILHPEDSALLRQYTATVINTAVHFNHLFSLSGYQWILPTMLQAYADYESNPLLRQAIEFSCRQFYILHRKPFVLQLFASVAPLLEFTTCTSSGLSKGMSAQCLFDLLVSLEGDSLDTLDALELVKAEKPLRSLDFCYGNEDLNFTISKAIKLCVTVVAYAPESFRSLHMLMVLEALVPCFLQKLKKATIALETASAARDEIAAIATLATSLQALLYSVEALTRCSLHMLMVLEALVPCFLQKLKKETITLETASAARDEIAAIATLATSLQALLYSVEALTRPMTAPQMSRCEQGHKGATTANHTVPGGADTRYFRDNLHLLEEGQGLPREELDERIAREEFRRPRESLLNICTEFYKHCGPRLKILQNMTGEPRVTTLELLDIKSHMRRQVEWEAASSLIEGICLTLQRQPIISFLPHLRSLINVCVNLVMGVVGPSSVADGLPLLHLSPYLSPPLPFSTAVVRLVALQIQALKDDFPLSHVISPFTNQERREGMLLNLLIPFVLTVGSGSKDSPHLEQPEVFLLLQTVINILLPPRIISTSRSKNFMMESSPAHCSTPGDTGKDLRREGLAESTSQAAYLALKVVLVCFERQLGNQWYQLSLQVKEMALRKVGGLALWDFIDFIVRTRIPIFILLRPFIQCKFPLSDGGGGGQFPLSDGGGGGQFPLSDGGGGGQFPLSDGGGGGQFPLSDGGGGGQFPLSDGGGGGQFPLSDGGGGGQFPLSDGGGGGQFPLSDGGGGGQFPLSDGGGGGQFPLSDGGGGGQFPLSDGGGGGQFPLSDGGGGGQFPLSDGGGGGQFPLSDGGGGGQFPLSDGGGGGQFPLSDGGGGGQFAEFNNELKILKEAVHSGADSPCSHLRATASEDNAALGSLQASPQAPSQTTEVAAYQGKTSISTVGTSTSAYRLSLATMSRSNTGTGTVWQQDSQPSHRASQDTLSRTDEDDEENDSVSMPSVVSEHEAYLASVIGRRRFSSHVSSASAPQAEPVLSSMLPSQRVASVQSEPGQQNLLVQPPLGRKRGLRQPRRPLLSIQKTQNEPRSRPGARLSTTRRSIQPKSRTLEQKRSVTFTEAQPEAATLSPPAESKECPSENQSLGVKSSSAASPSIVTADLHSPTAAKVETTGLETKNKEEPWSCLFPPPPPVLGTLPPPASLPRDSPGETSSLLPHTDTILHISEDNGTESPLLSPAFTYTHVELGEPEVEKTGLETKNKEEPWSCLSPPPPPVLGTLPPPASLPRDSPGETSSLLPHTDTILHISEDNGTESPLLSPAFTYTHVELGEPEVNLDESHV
ncbi:UNVERIFIED_CONTAM: hypothetical protein FKN15_009998 [Acipenser sinensis]